MAKISVKNPFKATVHILEYVPRKVGNKVREFTVDVNRQRVEDGLDKINFSDFKGMDEETVQNMEMDVLLVLEKLNLIVCKNLIDKVEKEGGAEVENIEDFLEKITDEDFKQISEITGELYKTAMENIEKKTNPKPS